jgi:hypothetical protein
MIVHSHVFSATLRVNLNVRTFDVRPLYVIKLNPSARLHVRRSENAQLRFGFDVDSVLLRFQGHVYQLQKSWNVEEYS